MRLLITTMLVVVAIIHLVPITGVRGADKLSALYGISASEPNLLILMRHRAVLFGIIGAFILFAAFKPEFQTLAFIVGYVSVLSFFWLAWSVGDYNPRIARIITGDLVALACLIIGSSAHIYTRFKT